MKQKLLSVIILASMSMSASAIFQMDPNDTPESIQLRSEYTRTDGVYPEEEMENPNGSLFDQLAMFDEVNPNKLQGKYKSCYMKALQMQKDLTLIYKEHSQVSQMKNGKVVHNPTKGTKLSKAELDKAVRYFGELGMYAYTIYVDSDKSKAKVLMMPIKSNCIQLGKMYE